MSVFTGSAVAIVTPLDNNGVQKEVFAQLIAYQITEGTDAIVVCGTTGEPSTMTQQEKHDAISFCIEQVNGRIPVIVGTGGNNTKQVVADSANAEAMGADALLVVTPYYNKCTQQGLVAHYHMVADHVGVPIIVYNVPGRTGVNIEPETMARLFEHKNIVGIKEATGNMRQVGEFARLCPEMDIYSGDDDCILPIMAYGGKGVISVLANIAPRMTHELIDMFLRGDVVGCRNLQLMLNPLVKSLFCEVNPIPVKTAVQMMGFDVGEVRLPLTPLSPKNQEELKRNMRQLGLL